MVLADFFFFRSANLWIFLKKVQKRWMEGRIAGRKEGRKEGKKEGRKEGRRRWRGGEWEEKGGGCVYLISLIIINNLNKKKKILYV